MNNLTMAPPRPGNRSAERDRIKQAIERKIQIITERPSVARGTATTRVRLDSGLRCEIIDGNWSFAVDMHRHYGGDNTDPNPGVFARGAFGSCIAIGYAMWAARLGVPIESVDVVVEADYDASGELAISEDVDPGYLAVRFNVTVTSDAPEDDILRVLDSADRYSSIRDVFIRAIPVERNLEILPTNSELQP